ncbi:hypothetical protein BJV77DRAFT_1093433, partial [Russula vinacea]
PILTPSFIVLSKLRHHSISTVHVFSFRGSIATIIYLSARARPLPSTTRRIMHASFMHPAAVRLRVTNPNRPPLSSMLLHSAGIVRNLTYDRLQLITPYRMPQRCAISSDSGDNNTAKAFTASLHRLRPIGDLARPALLVGAPRGRPCGSATGSNGGTNAGT